MLSRRVLSGRTTPEEIAAVLASGGDGRIKLGGSYFEWASAPQQAVNAYGTSTMPRSDVIERSSCTSNSPSAIGFEAAFAAASTSNVSALVASNRSRLAGFCGISTQEVAIVKADSGTSAEMVAALVGLGRSRHRGVTGGGVVATEASVLTVLMPGTGSGVAEAASLRAHSTLTPAGATSQPGEALSGFPDGVVKACEPVRDGVDATNVNELVAYISNKRPGQAHVLLHVVAGSKTGLHAPTLRVAESAALLLGSTTLVVDCCQFRVKPAYIKQCLAAGHVVLVTASKFFGAPPFCGAALLPAQAAKDADLAIGKHAAAAHAIADYWTRDDFPSEHFPCTRASLPDTHNLGLAVRWAVGLTEMERFAALAEDVTDAVARRWVSRIKALAEGFYPRVELLDIGEDEEAMFRVGLCNTIVSILVRANGALLTVKDLKLLTLLAAADLSPFCDDNVLPAEAAAIATKRMHLGQPVLLGGAHHGCVRIAISSGQVVGVAAQNDQERALNSLAIQDLFLFRKLDLVANHWSKLLQAVQQRSTTDTAAATDDRTIVNVDISWLKPHERVVSQERVDALVEAISRWGEYRKPLLVDRRSGAILDGHHRYFAAQRLGLAKVPAALIDYLDDDSINVDLWPGDHGLTSLTKQDVIDMCLSADVFPPKTSKHTFVSFPDYFR